MKFGYYLAELRTARGFTQSEVASKIGVTTSYICDVEIGRKPPFAPRPLGKLCESLSLDKYEQQKLTRLAVTNRKTVTLELPSENPEYGELLYLLAQLQQKKRLCRVYSSHVKDKVRELFGLD